MHEKCCERKQKYLGGKIWWHANKFFFSTSDSGFSFQPLKSEQVFGYSNQLTVMLIFVFLKQRKHGMNIIMPSFSWQGLWHAELFFFFFCYVKSNADEAKFPLQYLMPIFVAPTRRTTYPTSGHRRTWEDEMCSFETVLVRWGTLGPHRLPSCFLRLEKKEAKATTHRHPRQMDAQPVSEPWLPRVFDPP